MKIILISQWYSEKMGYSSNFLPKELALLGHEVHLITSTAQVYYNSPAYKETFEPLLGPGILEPYTKKIDGYILLRLPFWQCRKIIFLKGLLKKIYQLKPDIVQCEGISDAVTYGALILKPLLRYKLFLESHIHASVFRPAKGSLGINQRLYWFIYRNTIGRLINLMIEKCFAISNDAGNIAKRFFGINKSKIIIRSLGTDIDLFKMPRTQAQQKIRKRLREKLGFSQKDIVCIYTGRFGGGKNSLLLAQAIDKLAAQKEPFKGLFVGNGVEAEVQAIKNCRDCVVYAYVPTKDLPHFYWAADIAVWPAQESTSQLDAIACGLPIILSNKVQVRERVEGNGLYYKEGNLGDLIKKITMLKRKKIRLKLGKFGAEKMKKKYSWRKIAKEYTKDYEEALSKKEKI